MHTEHLQNVRFGMVGLGWVIAVGLASLIVIALFALNVVEPDSEAGTRLSIAAVAIGFFVGGYFTGALVNLAPVLHGVALGLLSLAVWFVLNVLSSLAFPDFGWQSLTAELSVSLILIQIVAAVLGARFAYRRALKKA